MLLYAVLTLSQVSLCVCVCEGEKELWSAGHGGQGRYSSEREKEGGTVPPSLYS